MKILILLLWLIATSAAGVDIALDVGHSKRHPGAISASGVPEWELNRRLALDIAARLVKSPHSFRLIGADGSMDVLTERTAAARSDMLFISLHHDAVLPEWQAHAERYSGFSLFVSRKNPRLEESLACARHIGDRLRMAGFQPSHYHAVPVKGENRPFADAFRGVHYYDGLAVLRTAQQPAVLIEAGVVVNPRDEINVTSKEGRGRVADALVLAMTDCLSAIGTLTPRK
ncbi:MAG: N-acetylmuramoyl-L-alanine amidase [Gammaproteobacteria bacterium]